MSGPAKYFIVEADAMPEIFRKVAEAKRLLETGEERTVNRAVQAVNISRSAFYKYKDAVRPFHDMLHGRIVTFQVLLRDEPGILSGVVLAIGRIVGETAALLFTAGTVADMPKHFLLSSGRTLAVHMYQLSLEGLHYGQAYATGVVLLLLVLGLNSLSSLISRKIGGKAS